MPSALEANAAAFLALVVLGIGGIMLLVSGLSWSRLRHPKLLFTTAAFGVLAAKGAWAALPALQGQAVDLVAEVLDVALALLLYASVAKR